MLVKRGLGINVVEAAKQRIIKAFRSQRVVWLSFSGGKDSLVLAHIVMGLLQEGKIDKRWLRVIFIDEEAMYEDVIDIVKQWRMKFLEIGVPFDWYCLPVKHFNCLNTLKGEETFICWGPAKRDSWVREMPSFAIKDDEFLIPYKDNYQSFQERKRKYYNAIHMFGVRVSESIQRKKNIAWQKTDNLVLPIYDMDNKDIWLYLQRYNIDFPSAYEDMYRSGVSINNLRISQFFSIDTAKCLVNLEEIRPGLMEKVIKREPNAYLCAMYWDTEMFGRTTSKRKKLEDGQAQKDYRKLAMQLMTCENPEHPETVNHLKPIILRLNTTESANDNECWKSIYQVLVTGDPKRRTLRGIYQKVFNKYDKMDFMKIENGEVQNG